MRPRMVGLAAVLMLGLAASTGRAQLPDKDKATTVVDRADVDRRLAKAAYDAAALGTEIFNKKNYEGCYRLYQGTLLGIQPLLDNRPKLSQSVKEKMDRARNQSPTEGAFTLRAAIDEIMADIAPPTSKPSEPGKGSPTFPGAAPETKTLWDRLGGTDGVRKIIDLVLLQAIEDPKVKLYPDIKKLDLKQIEAQKRGIRDWISGVTGGPFKYEGKSMKEVHARMMITNEQFDAFANIIESVLKRQGVALSDVKEFMGIVESTRKEIVTVTAKGKG